MNRGAANFTPLLLTGVSRASRSTYLPLSRRHPALAILVPHRLASTDTSNPTSTSNTYPPPGFNAEQVKRPLRPDQEKQNQQAQEASEAERLVVPAPKDGHIPAIAAAGQHKHMADFPKASTDKTSEEKDLTALAADKAAFDKATEKKVEEKKKGEEKKLTLWQKVKREANHYWDGTKLLATEVRISSKLALKMAAGYELTRRENRQVRHTRPAYSSLGHVR